MNGRVINANQEIGDPRDKKSDQGNWQIRG